MRNPLAALLDEVAAGRFPAADGSVTILPQPSPRDAGVIAFTAHAVVFTDADAGWVRSLLPPGDLAAPLSPPFLQALCTATGREAHSIDMLCVAQPLPGPPPVELTPVEGADHPRIKRALGFRDEVTAWRADGGVVLLGRGVAGRWETAIEVDPDCRDKGLGRRLATAARHLIAARAATADTASAAHRQSVPLWAQIAPGNAASVRAFLAAGFVPVGAEALLSRS
jgi:GNAT superfamily N-acetyltransferase